MPVGPVIHRVYPTDSFTESWKDLPPEIRESAVAAIPELVKPPSERSSSLNIRPLEGRGSKGIWAITISPKGLYIATFKVDGDTAFLRRVGLYEELEKHPE